MRLLLITDDYLPHRGGPRNYFHELLSHLDHIEPMVLTRYRPGAEEFDRAQPYLILRCLLHESALLRRFRLQSLPVYANLWRHALATVRAYSPDIIAAGELVPTGLIAAILAALFKKPLVLFTHAEGPGTIAHTRLQSRLARWACRRADAVVPSSGHARRMLGLVAQVPEEKVHVVMSAVGEEHLDPAYMAHPCSDSVRPRRLLSIGHLTPRNGHLAVLKALPEVLQKIANLQYVIVGTGPLEEEIRAKAVEMGFSQNKVIIQGTLGPKDLLKEYSRSDCFILPNRESEKIGDTVGFNIVFLEASAHGLPVIGGRAANTEDSIHDGITGIRVDGGDSGAIAGAIECILSDPSFAQSLGHHGRKYVTDCMRWSDRARAFQEVLYSLFK